MSTVIAFSVAQFVKSLLEFWPMGTVKFERPLSNGNMPSLYSATVSTPALGTGYCYGAASLEFAVSFILVMIVMTGVIDVRQETGEQPELLNKMVETDLQKQEDSDLLPVELKELVGHIPLQIAAGIVVGILVVLVVGYGLYR